MKLETITENDIVAVSKLHKENLRSPSSSIGERYLRKVYSLMLRNDAIHLGLLIRDGKQIVGIIMTTEDLHKTNKILNKLFSLETILLISKAVILNKVILRELFDRWRFEQSIMKKFPEPFPSILTIVVDHTYQRHGFGKKLINECLKRFKEKGIKKIYVDTLKTNKKAIDFYQAIGFKKTTIIVDSVLLEKNLV